MLTGRNYKIELEIEDSQKQKWLRTNFKRDDFDFPIVNFPFMSGNIPANMCDKTKRIYKNSKQITKLDRDY